MANKKIKSKIFVIFGVSGSGQDSVVEGLMKKNFKAVRVVTTVTRTKRPGEREGRPYYFVTESKFKQLIKEKKMVEWDKHYGNYYGCTFKEINRVLKTGRIVFWKAEPRGALTIKNKFEKAVTIYIKPPSLKATLARIKKRKTDSPEVIQKRIEEIKEYLRPENDGKFDYVFINREGKLDRTIDQVLAAIEKEIKN